MRPGVGRKSGSSNRGLVASYRLQARLMWEWRPVRLALMRRALLSYVGACLALAITTFVLPGFRIDGLGALLLAGLLILVLDSSSDIVLQWLFVAWPIFVAQAIGLVCHALAIIAVGRVVPGVSVGGTGTAIWAAVLLTILNTLFAELVAVSDDDSYYGVLVRRAGARSGRSCSRRWRDPPSLGRAAAADDSGKSGGDSARPQRWHRGFSLV